MPVATPVFSRYTRATSPPLSSAPSLTAQTQLQKLHIVTRVAIEGNAKQGESGAAIKMYLKICLPLDNVTPGSTIPLFPEENIKILASQVHPIDNNSVPYNFSSTISPMLHNTARALMLPARSPQSYLSLFGLSPPSPFSAMSTSRYSVSQSSSSNTTPVLDDRYTGHILVSGYHVSFVLPREFPSRFISGSVFSNHESTPRRRRSSVSEKNVLQFMAVVELMVPFLTRPPRAPFLLSIPTPRCLSNTIKLRIFPPSTTASSFASLSSGEEEASTWDLTSDPYVTRSPSRPSRTNSYTHFADDESSDSSTTGNFDGCAIQGTFPSAERIRVRWAAPMKSVELPAGGDPRRKVGVKEAKGQMTCIVLGKGRDTSVGGSGKEGVIVRLEYVGSCKGVWFPGVATFLGMDIGLLAKNSDVTWVNGMEDKWTISGGVGFTGWDIAGTSSTPLDARDPSMESPMINELDISPPPASRHLSNASRISLLRSPLPTPNVPEYSFEGSGSSSAPSGTLSSVGSLPANSPNGTRSRAASISSTNGIANHHAEPISGPPVLPITIHLNMNELLPPSKNVFTFNISGVVLLTAKSRILNGSANSRSSSPTRSDEDTDMEPIVLPYFNVFAAESETTTIHVQNDAEGSTVDVYNSSGDIRQAQTRKTVLQRGGFTKCGMDGERIVVRPFRTPVFHRDSFENGRTPARPKTPNGAPSRSSSSSSLRQAGRGAAEPFMRPRRDGPLMIPSVVATVTPLSKGTSSLPNAYAVRVCLPAPADRDSEWLEFGFAQPSPTVSAVNRTEEGDAKPPMVDIASVSVGGVPVQFETGCVAKQEKDKSLAGLRLDFEEMNGKEWLTWVRVHVGEVAGGEVEVNYICKEDQEGTAKKGKGKEQTQLHVFLPAFLLPVGRLEVRIESAGLEILSLRTNLQHEHSTLSGPRLIHYSAEELFYPRLSFSVESTAHSAAHDWLPNLSSKLFRWITPMICLILLLCLLGLGMELRQMKRSLESHTIIGTGWSDLPESPTTVTVTTTVFAFGQSQWWLRGGTTTTSPTPTISSLDDGFSSTFTSFSSTPSITASTPETQALLVIHSLPFPWPPRFDLPPAHVVMTNLMDRLRGFWRIFRIAYHYPLPPP